MITLPYKFEPREYQLPLLKSLTNGCKRAVVVWARGLGKDLVAMNYAISQALRPDKIGVYLHCFPNYNQAKRAIWKSVHDTDDGEAISYLDHIPKQLIKHKNSSEMTIQFTNGSIYCVMGLDGKNAMRARGMNPRFVILSEYAFMDRESWHTVEPRVKQNNGTVIFISTPNGKNHFWELYDYARLDPTYFTSFKTVEDAGTLTAMDIEQLRKEGVPEDFIQQEYYCSFNRGSEGSYYGKLIQQARDENRIWRFQTYPGRPIHTCWDIGIGDSTAIWFFQRLNSGTYSFVHYYENQGEGLEHYLQYLNKFKLDNSIEYGKHFVPHDMKNREFTSGVDRLETAREFGYRMDVVPRKPIDEGIQAVRSILPMCKFHADNCAYGIKCLDFYRKKYNEALKTYYDVPTHDKWSHGADSLRCGVIGINLFGLDTNSSVSQDFEAAANFWGSSV